MINLVMTIQSIINMHVAKCVLRRKPEFNNICTVELLLSGKSGTCYCPYLRNVCNYEIHANNYAEILLSVCTIQFSG